MPAKKGVRKNLNKGKKSTLTAKEVKKIVKQQVKTVAETKHKISNIFSATPVPGGGLSDTSGGYGAINHNIFNTLQVSQGTEQDQRVGNKITSCNLKLSGFICSKLYSSVTNPFCAYEAHMIVFKSKRDPFVNNPNYIVSLPADNNDRITGTVMNSCYPWNKDGYTILKHKVWRMLPRVPDNPPSVTTVPGVNVDSSAVAFKRFKIFIDIKNTLLYNDNENIPTNESIAVGFYFINGNGQDSSASHQKFDVWMDAEIHYKDL
jgi:hypothetical protein